MPIINEENSANSNRTTEVNYKPTGKIGKRLDLLDKKMDSLYKDIYITRTDNKDSLNYIKSNIPVLGILVGMDSTKNIAKNTTYKYYNIIKSEYKYQDKIKHEFLNPTYEAKCVPYLEENDTLYVVA